MRPLGIDRTPGPSRAPILEPKPNREHAYLAVRSPATDVPTTVADGRAIVVGSVAGDAYVEAIVGAAG
jgi:hypothetical protein